MIAAKTASRDDPWRSFPVRVLRIVEEAPSIFTYDIEFVDPIVGNQFRFFPGQFNMLYVPGVGEAAISISGQSRRDGLLRHTVRTVGNVTRAMQQGGVGFSLGLRGPFGSSWPIDQCFGVDAATAKDVVIVAGGIGLAPLRSAIDALLDQSPRLGKLSVLIGARSPDDLIYQEEFETWREQGVELQTTVDRATEAWHGNVGVVTTLLDRWRLPRPRDTIVLTCGPEVMMRYVVQSALQRQIPASHVYLSLERNMNCAIGLCGHCQMGPEFLCKDGPVFAYPRVVDWLKVEGL